MPLKLNVGTCKKIGQPHYGSLGASCYVEIELDQSLIFDDVDAFQQRVMHDGTLGALRVPALIEPKPRTNPGHKTPSPVGFKAYAVPPSMANRPTDHVWHRHCKGKSTNVGLDRTSEQLVDRSTIRQERNGATLKIDDIQIGVDAEVLVQSGEHVPRADRPFCGKATIWTGRSDDLPHLQSSARE